MSVAAALRLARSLGLAIVLSLAFALALALLAGDARAAAPDPRYSTYDRLVFAAPDGGTAFTVTLRDASSQPVAGATVLLDFNSAQGVVLCEAQDEDHDRRLVGISGANGVVTFVPQAGGFTAGRVTVHAGGAPLGEVAVRTPDLDGDRDVDAADRAALAALVGTATAYGDLNDDGRIDAADQALLEQHFGATCGQPGTRSATWGALKDLYR